METYCPIQNIVSRIKFKVKFKDISFNKDGHTLLPPLISLVNVYANENQAYFPQFTDTISRHSFKGHIETRQPVSA